jgi:hypothetical protein
MLVRLKNVQVGMPEKLFEQGWRLQAPKGLMAKGRP